MKSGINPNIVQEEDGYNEYAADETDFQHGLHCHIDDKKEFWDYKDGYGIILNYTPLDYALIHGQYAAADMLLQYGADINFNPHSIMYVSSETRLDAKAIEYLATHGFRMDRRHDKGRTELHMLVWQTAQKYIAHWKEQDLKDCIVALNKAGVDMNAVDENGNTVLHMLLKLRQSSNTKHMIQTVLEQGIDINKKDADGKDVLQISAENREASQDEELKCLLQKYCMTTSKKNSNNNKLLLTLFCIGALMVPCLQKACQQSLLQTYSTKLEVGPKLETIKKALEQLVNGRV